MTCRSSSPEDLSRQKSCSAADMRNSAAEEPSSKALLASAPSLRSGWSWPSFTAMSRNMSSFSEGSRRSIGFSSSCVALSKSASSPRDVPVSKDPQLSRERLRDAKTGGVRVLRGDLRKALCFLSKLDHLRADLIPLEVGVPCGADFGVAVTFADGERTYRPRVSGRAPLDAFRGERTAALPARETSFATAWLALMGLAVFFIAASEGKGAVEAPTSPSFGGLSPFNQFEDGSARASGFRFRPRRAEER
mmetsp:Transcript_5496/g.21717  ORF Transcript_5496/g.21717 Transcript_5496/m.21717 type:complete len:249 (+) Transcript_5496:2372-3118(+)